MELQKVNYFNCGSKNQVLDYVVGKFPRFQRVAGRLWMLRDTISGELVIVRAQQADYKQRPVEKMAAYWKSLGVNGCLLVTPEQGNWFYSHGAYHTHTVH